MARRGFFFNVHTIGYRLVVVGKTHKIEYHVKVLWSGL